MSQQVMVYSLRNLYPSHPVVKVLKRVFILLSVMLVIFFSFLYKCINVLSNVYYYLTTQNISGICTFLIMKTNCHNIDSVHKL